MGLAAAIILGVLAAPPISSEAQGDPNAKAIRALGNDRSMKVRTQAAVLLGRNKATAAVPALMKALERDEAAPVRIAAAAALGLIRDPKARNALESARSTDPDVSVREAAKRALANLDSALPTVVSQSVVIEPPQGKGDASARASFTNALARDLGAKGYKVGANGGSALRVKPAILTLDVNRQGDTLTIQVKASLVAIDATGRVAALVESGAKLKAEGVTKATAMEAQLVSQALEAIAKNLVEDMHQKLQ